MGRSTWHSTTALLRGARCWDWDLDPTGTTNIELVFSNGSELKANGTKRLRQQAAIPSELFG